MNKYYSMSVSGREADIYIFGDIVTPDWQGWNEMWGDMSSVSGLSIANDVRELDVDTINVHINSYGGSVSEGLAIYNVLKSHKAKIVTVVDGFACSAASVVFMAGERRIMSEASLLMVHNAWMSTYGNAAELRKAADDIDKIMQAVKAAYLSGVSVSDNDLQALLDAESWIVPNEALEKGFATEIIAEEIQDSYAASARTAVFAKMTAPKLAIENAEELKPFDTSANIPAEVAEMLKSVDEKVSRIEQRLAVQEPATGKNIANFLNALSGRKD